MSVYGERAVVAALTRSREADDPDLVDARRNLTTAKLAQYIERTVAAAPPLTDEQCDRLVAILRGAGA